MSFLRCERSEANLFHSVIGNVRSSSRLFYGAGGRRATVGCGPRLDDRRLCHRVPSSSDRFRLYLSLHRLPSTAGGATPLKAADVVAEPIAKLRRFRFALIDLCRRNTTHVNQRNNNDIHWMTIFQDNPGN